MGKLKVIQSGPMTTIQDFGRFGYRRYGIPQSGAMDKEWMIASNQLVGNPDFFPVLEFAMTGMKLEALEPTLVTVVGAAKKLNDKDCKNAFVQLAKGDVLQVAPPTFVYAYLAIGGKLKVQEDFESYSTYSRAGFGGIEGRGIRNGDILITTGKINKSKDIVIPERRRNNPILINILKGPEWNLLKDYPGSITFKVDSSSDRMGVRLKGGKLDIDYKEISSSAVIPGTIQLPANGHPIVLMNDCQTTGGYPRIGKVIDEDMGRLAQLRPGSNLYFNTITSLER